MKTLSIQLGTIKIQLMVNQTKSILNAIKETIELVDKGVLRVAEKKDNEWVVHQWIKKAILLSFKTNEMQTHCSGPYTLHGMTNLRY